MQILLADRYRLGEIVYNDALVTVHRGHDQVLNRPVTIEWLKAPDAGAAQALADKARRMALSPLPHVAALYDQGEHEGRSFLVYEELLGQTLAQAAPLQPPGVLGVIQDVAATLRGARSAGTILPRIDPHALRLVEGRTQIIDWGVSSPLQNELAILAPLLAFAATGSPSGQMTAPVPGPLMRIVRAVLDGSYTSADLLEQDLQRAVQTSEQPTVAVPRAHPTIIVKDHASAPDPRDRRPRPAIAPAGLPRSRRGLLLGGLGLLAVLGILSATLWLRDTSGTADAADQRPASAATTQSEASSGDAQAPAPNTSTPRPTTEGGRPYIVATANGRRLNVRNEPGTRGTQVVGVLTNGTEVSVYDEPVERDGFRWIRVESGNLSGWCVFDALRPRDE